MLVCLLRDSLYIHVSSATMILEQYVYMLVVLLVKLQFFVKYILLSSLTTEDYFNKIIKVIFSAPWTAQFVNVCLTNTDNTGTRNPDMRACSTNWQCIGQQLIWSTLKLTSANIRSKVSHVSLKLVTIVATLTSRLQTYNQRFRPLLWTGTLRIRGPILSLSADRSATKSYH
jgi:hypothetical protein